jgi:hypothetical protein
MLLDLASVSPPILRNKFRSIGATSISARRIFRDDLKLAQHTDFVNKIDMRADVSKHLENRTQIDLSSWRTTEGARTTTYKPLYALRTPCNTYQLHGYGDNHMNIVISRIPVGIPMSALIRNMDHALTKSGIDLVETPITYYEHQLRLYVWTDFCPDKAGGMAVAIAETVEEAKQIVKKAHGPLPVWDWGTLTIHDIKPYATCIDGGE